MSTTRRQRLRQRRLTVSAAGAALVGATLVAWSLGVFSPETAHYVPAPEQTVASAQGEYVDGSHRASRAPGGVLGAHEPVEAPETAPETPAEVAVSAVDSEGRFVVEDLGLSVPLSQQSFPSDGVLTPENFVSAWEVVDEQAGYRGSRDGVRLITLHSSSSIASAPGNALVRDGSPLVDPGDMFSVDGVVYEVESAEIVTKGEIPAEVFSDAPGRLVVVTCSPQGTPSSTSNLVIVASEVSTP